MRRIRSMSRARWSAPILLIAAMAACITACGSSTTRTVTVAGAARTVTVTAATTAASAATTPSTAATADDCASLEIGTPNQKAGRCSRDGNRYVTAASGGEARLRTIAAKLVGCHEQQTVSDGFGQSETAHGTFEICTLTVRNRTDSPQTFDSIGSPQTLLIINGKQFSEAFDAENQADQRSFVSQDGDIQPSESSTGDVIFDISPKFVAQVHKAGALLVLDFGESTDSATSAAVLSTAD